MSFTDVRNTFPLKAMRIVPNHADENLLMPTQHGRRRYAPAPADPLGLQLAQQPPTHTEAADESRYLWVITTEDVPHAFERCSWARSLNTDHKLLKHSNLTEGRPAHCGGELWFVNESQIIINFCSGRYGATSDADEPLMEAIIDALVYDGYQVCHTGTDKESGYPSSKLLIGCPVYRARQDG